MDGDQLRVRALLILVAAAFVVAEIVGILPPLGADDWITPR